MGKPVNGEICQIYLNGDQEGAELESNPSNNFCRLNTGPTWTVRLNCDK